LTDEARLENNWERSAQQLQAIFLTLAQLGLPLFGHRQAGAEVELWPPRCACKLGGTRAQRPSVISSGQAGGAGLQVPGFVYALRRQRRFDIAILALNAASVGYGGYGMP
jgi:hypothetical protein